MTLRSLRQTLDRKSALAAFAVLTIGIIVTAAAVASYPRATQPAPSTLLTDGPNQDGQIPPRRDFSPLRYVVVVVLLAGGGALALHLKSRGKVSGNGSAIRTIAKEHVGNGQQIRLIEVGSDRILIGITPSRMTVLHTNHAEETSHSFDDVLEAETLRRSA